MSLKREESTESDLSEIGKFQLNDIPFKWIINLISRWKIVEMEQ